MAVPTTQPPIKTLLQRLDHPAPRVVVAAYKLHAGLSVLAWAGREGACNALVTSIMASAGL